MWESDPELNEVFLKEERSRDKDHSLKISSLMPFPLSIPTPDGTILNLEGEDSFFNWVWPSWIEICLIANDLKVRRLPISESSSRGNICKSEEPLFI